MTISSDTANAAPDAHQGRPLSPHLQIFRFRIPLITSILHRITGAALVVGSFILLWWLIALAQGEEAYGQFVTIASHPLGQICLFGWTWAFLYQLLNGVRHLFYDAGKGFNLKTTYLTGWLVLILSVLFTALAWCFIHCAG